MWSWFCSHAGKFSIAFLVVAVVSAVCLPAVGVGVLATSIVAGGSAAIGLFSSGMYASNLVNQKKISEQANKHKEELAALKLKQNELKTTAKQASECNPTKELQTLSTLTASVESQAIRIAALEAANRTTNELRDSQHLNVERSISDHKKELDRLKVSQPLRSGMFQAAPPPATPVRGRVPMPAPTFM